MYQAIYRKWRPKTFDDVFGQDHITTTLRAQVASGRVSHAYLFTGIRGTGKTTCAKLLARAVNCEHPINGNPCNKCPTCRGILDGSIMDVLELDAASNTGVDNIRSILDETIYPPANAKRRVYIIDEVHMLSAGAFNALLKTLEEPPEYVMFILATTELNKVAPTILSRCQRFDFKRIDPETIGASLSRICAAEKISITPQAISLLSRFADGSSRDSQSLLERCIAGEDRENVIDADKVISALGIAPRDSLLRMADAIAEKDAGSALLILDELYRDGRDLRTVLGSLSSYFRDMLLIKTAPGAEKLITAGTDVDELKENSKKYDTARLFRGISAIQETLDKMSRSAGGRIETELCLISLCSDITAFTEAKPVPAEQTVQAGGNIKHSAPEHRPEKVFHEEKKIKEQSVNNNNANEEKQDQDNAADEERTPSAMSDADVKEKLLSSLAGKLTPSQKRFAFSAGYKIKGDIITIIPDGDMTRSMLERPEVRDAMMKAGKEAFGHAVRIQMEGGQRSLFDGFDSIMRTGREAGIEIKKK